MVIWGFSIFFGRKLYAGSLIYKNRETLVPCFTFSLLNLSVAHPSLRFYYSLLLTMSSADAEHREEEEPLAGDDEDTGAQVAPIVRLEEVAVSTGEENEDAILDLYVFAFSDSFPV